MLQAITTTNTLTGHAGLTQFTFTSKSLTDTSIQKYVWSTGDGSYVYDDLSFTKSYNIPGLYTVELDIWDENNNHSTVSTTLSVVPYIQESLYFSTIPINYPGPGTKTDIPFTLTFFTTLTGLLPKISLYAANSQSIPSETINSNAWKQITPRWRFLDAKSNTTTQLTATNFSTIYYNNTPVGLSGTVDFYFIDDRGINNPFQQTPTIIVATLETTNTDYPLLHTNNGVQKATLWYTDRPIPGSLNITENYIQGINSLKWSGVEIPFLVTANYSKNHLYTVNGGTSSFDLNITKSPDILSAVAFELPQSEVTNAIQRTLINGVSGNFTNNAPYFINTVNTLPDGGYILDSVYINANDTLTTAISTSLILPVSSYSPSVFTSSYINIFNAENNTINRIYSLPHPVTDRNIANLKRTKVLETSWQEPVDLSYNPTLTAVPTNLYCVATDVSDLSYWVTDPDRIVLYKFDKYNKPLAEISLSATFTELFTNYKNDIPVNQIRPLQVVLDRDKNLWLSLYNSNDILKFDNNGNYITKTNYDSYVLDSCNNFKPTKTELNNNGTVFSLIDVDYDNNLVATHTNIIYNEYRKYDSTGSIIQAVLLSGCYTPTCIHVDKNNNTWITSQLSPYLIKPSQDKYEYYWNWFNLKGSKYSPLTWNDTRSIGLSNTVNNQLIYPAGNFPKKWKREAFNDTSLLTGRYNTLTSYVTAFKTMVAVIPEYNFREYVFTIPPGGEFQNIYVYPLSTLNLSQAFTDINVYDNLVCDFYDYSFYQANKNNINAIYTSVYPFNLDKIATDTGDILYTGSASQDQSIYGCDNNLYLVANSINGTDNYSNDIRNLTTSQGMVYRFKPNGKFTVYSDFSRPNFITSDKSNNIWIAHSYNNIATINLSGNITNWSINNTNLITTPLSVAVSQLNPINQPYYTHNLGIRGLACDFFNRVWFVNNADGRSYNFYAPDLLNTYTSYNAVIGNNKNVREKLIQSFGDSSGINWYSKFVLPKIKEGLEIILTGLSNSFTVKPLSAVNYIRIKNENFDAAGQIKSLALPENLANNTVLFDTLIKGIVGDVNDNRQNLGKDVYAKIANYTTEHSDIDLATIESMFSMAQSLGVKLNFDNIKYPYEIKRLLDVVSIPYKKLFGYENKNIDIKNSALTKLHTESSYVSAGDLLLVKFNNNKTQSFFTVPLLSTGLTNNNYPLSTIVIPDLVNYTYLDYEIFNVDPTYYSSNIDSYIDWSNDNTLLSPNTTLSSWYSDNGIIEELINYTLTKNLLT